MSDLCKERRLPGSALDIELQHGAVQRGQEDPNNRAAPREDVQQLAFSDRHVELQ